MAEEHLKFETFPFFPVVYICLFTLCLLEVIKCKNKKCLKDFVTISSENGKKKIHFVIQTEAESKVEQAYFICPSWKKNN